MRCIDMQHECKITVLETKCFSKFICIFLILTLVLTVTGCRESASPEQESEAQTDTGIDMLSRTGRTQYTAALSISRPESMEDFVYVQGNQSISFQNDSEDPWNEIVFREFSPSVLTQEAWAVSTEGRSRPYDPGEAQHTAIESVSQEGEPLEFREENDPSIVKVLLKEPLEPGAACTIDMTFTVKVTAGSSRQGFEQVDFINKDDHNDASEITVSLGPILPVLAKYVDGEWICHEYFEDGECFFTDCADYHVEVTLPEGFTVVASGKETLNADGTFSIVAENMRDFTLIAGDLLGHKETKWGNITVRSWYYDNGNEVYAKAAERALDIAVDALETFTEYYGEYAYDELDIVFTPFHHAGMESPGLIRIDDLACLTSSEADDSGEGDESYRSFRTNIVHEIAHEWFYASVGNDCFTEPWLDEGFARFSELIFAEKNGLNETAKELITTSREKYEGSGKGPINIASDEASIFQESDPEDYAYGWTVYEGSALFLYDLREAMGEDRFDDFMHDWYSNHMNSIVTTEQFLRELYQADDSKKVHETVDRYMK